MSLESEPPANIILACSGLNEKSEPTGYESDSEKTNKFKVFPPLPEVKKKVIEPFTADIFGQDWFEDTPEGHTIRQKALTERDYMKSKQIYYPVVGYSSEINAQNFIDACAQKEKSR